jgi:hypothetical protein
MAIVYRHIRLDNGQPFYIGIGVNLDRAYNKTKRSIYWKIIVNTHNYEVEILFNNLTYEEAIEKEKEFIKLYGRINNNTGILVNLTDGGDGSIGYIPSKETLLKIGEKSKGRIKTKEQIEKWKSKMTFSKSQETKDKIRQSLIGKKHTEERKENQRKLRLGKKLSEEAKRKLSEYWKGKKKGPFSEEHKQKLSEARIKYLNKQK